MNMHKPVLWSPALLAFAVAVMILLSCTCPTPVSPSVMVVTATPSPSPALAMEPPEGTEPSPSPPTAVPTATSLPKAKIVTTAIVPTATSLPKAKIVTTAVIPTATSLPQAVIVTTAITPKTTTTFRLINKSPRPICWLFLDERYSSPKWGAARIVPANPLRPGEERTFELEPGTYNLQVKDCNNQVMDEQYGIAIAGETFRWVISH
ncbi:MAG: hypothetical protein KKA73_10160 [Chloroflexi bacterium]|nr:hypothetical protein [Chloroflexota bacterium]MBU1748040.1 hypothetical protein [Chloroflexota bacterium]MBU1877542.1 hypothetical protein [Chloroflexota bacterium]